MILFAIGFIVGALTPFVLGAVWAFWQRRNEHDRPKKLRLKVGREYALRKAPNNPRKRVLITEYDPTCTDSSFRGRFVGSQEYSRWFPDGSHCGPGHESGLDLLEIER
jgi:hypothetical protein